MKNILPIVVLVVFAFACKSKTAEPETAPNSTNVQNVNGNQPDTTTGIQLDTRQSSDTTMSSDTTHH